MSERQRRALRGAGAAGLAVFIAAWFHIAAGGAAPTPLAVAVSIVLAAPACVLLACRRTSGWRLALSVSLSQFLLHALFSLGQARGATFTGDAEMAGMPGAGLRVTSVGSAAAASAGGFSIAAMWAGHAVAAALTIAIIRHGERTVARLIALAARFLVRVLALLVPVAGEVRRPVARASRRRATPVRLLSGAWRHRGPPVRFAP